MKPPNAVLVAVVESPEHKSTFAMDVKSSALNNTKFWESQVADFLSAADKGPAKLVVTTETQWSNSTPQKQATTMATTNAPNNTPVAPFRIIKAAAIPVPSRGRRKQPISDIYPFKAMEVGDSFNVSGKKNIQTARNAAQQWAKLYGPSWRFITRDLSGQPDGQGGVHPLETYGVWRMPPTSVVVHDTVSGEETTVQAGERVAVHPSSNEPAMPRTITRDGNSGAPTNS